MGAVANSFEALYQAFEFNNLSGAINQLADSAFTFETALFTKADWYQRIVISLGFGAVFAKDTVSGGSVSTALALVGVYQLATDLIFFFGSTRTHYNTVYPDG